MKVNGVAPTMHFPVLLGVILAVVLLLTAGYIIYFFYCKSPDQGTQVALSPPSFPLWGA